MVATVIFILYGLWILARWMGGHDVHESIVFGHRFVDQPHAAQLMHVNPHAKYVEPDFGNDGQFYYYIAVNPIQGRYFVDDASYRYKRILYPMVARGLALGRAQLVPYTLILVNWLAIAGGTLAIAAWLRRKRVSPWLALIYGLYPGVFVTFQRDLAEPLSYGLVALGIYLFSLGGRWQLLGSPAAFALATLSRDKAVAFAALYGLAVLVRHVGWDARAKRLTKLEIDIRGAAVFASVLGVPVLGYLLFLKLWLHSVPSPIRQLGAPLSGVTAAPPLSANEVMAVVCVYIPSVVCLVMCAWALVRGFRQIEVFVLLMTVLASVVFVNAEYYHDVFGGLLRVSVGVLLMALYCIPVFDRLRAGRRWWLWIAAVGWLALLPAVAGAAFA